ncbi:hypothetical protein H9P43_002202 [Blastocladiella emersonii ATCC 22665]|nr:hypothetical protein H9P43_002202 [Blastocladiella emersonii ATCC 22665]
MSEAIRVCLRCRPFSEKERAQGFTKVVTFDSPTSVTLVSPKSPEDTKQFTFDAVFDEQSEQLQVYDATARSIVDAVLSGFNGTVFVYGQTGTGKSFSMQGIPDNPALRGIIPNAFNQIFAHITEAKDRKFLVRVSFLEIYNEEVRDLLTVGASGKPVGPLEVKEHPDTGVYVKDLQAFPVQSVSDMDKLMDRGNKNRAVAATDMNATSSRSHSIFTITIESAVPDSGDGTPGHIIAGKLHLVDLAGSERQGKTGATGDRLKEAAKINLSLSALGNCISALVDGKSSHVPYRDSKLTRLLQDSLGGNAKTLMIATMSPASYNYDETLSTLRYANRAKNIKNKPKVNEDPKDALLREYQLEIARLQEMLKMRAAAKKTGNSPTPSAGPAAATKPAAPAAPKPAKPAAGAPSSSASTATASASPSAAPAEPEDPSLHVDEDAETALSQLDPSTLQALAAEIEAEKARLLASKDMAADEQERLLAELDARADHLETERAAREALAAQLAALESKLLVGGVHLQDHISAQELELEKTRAAAQAEAEKQRAMRAQLDAMLEGNMALEGEYASLQEEVDVKTRKLTKLWAKLEQAKREAADIDAEWRTERADLTAAIRELARELELKATVIDLFVPPDERRKLESRLVLDTDDEDADGVTNEWRWLPASAATSSAVGPGARRPVAVPGSRRPMAAAARALVEHDPDAARGRYMGDNLVEVPLYGGNVIRIRASDPRMGIPLLLLPSEGAGSARKRSAVAGSSSSSGSRTKSPGAASAMGRSIGGVSAGLGGSRSSSTGRRGTGAGVP